MLRVHVCEDDKKQRERIVAFISEIMDMEELDMELGLVSENPEEMLKQVEKEKETGVYFLDIDLQHEMNGIELASNIREYQPRCFIIFVTTHSEMSYMTFTYKVEAMDFIIKDNYQELKGRIHECLLHAEQLYQEANMPKPKSYLVKQGDRMLEVPYEDILYIQSSSSYHKVVLCAKNQIMEFTGKLKEIQGELDDRFYRCHRSCLVNKEKIVEIKDNEIMLEGGESCPLSIRMKKGLL